MRHILLPSHQPDSRSSLGTRASALAKLSLCALALAACSTPEPVAPPAPSQAPWSLDDVAGRSQAHVTQLAQVIGPRNDDHPQAYTQAQSYIQQALAPHLSKTARSSLALHPVKTSQGAWPNIEVTFEGTDPTLESIVLGAHYDSCYKTPGADDNASGVAALLEIHRWLSTQPQTARTIRLVFFANEEPPHFKRDTMGSLQYARMAHARGDRILAMFSLEMLGYYKTEPGSQKYPSVLKALYPDTGDFVAFVSSWTYGAITAQSARLFGAQSPMHVESYTGPIIPGVDFSDHWSFWQMGYPAIMITDTSFFRTPHYHKPTDTPETLDYPRMAQAIEGVAKMTYALAMRPKDGSSKKTK